MIRTQGGGRGDFVVPPYLFKPPFMLAHRPTLRLDGVPHIRSAPMLQPRFTRPSDGGAAAPEDWLAFSITPLRRPRPAGPGFGEGDTRGNLTWDRQTVPKSPQQQGKKMLLIKHTRSAGDSLRLCRALWPGAPCTAVIPCPENPTCGAPSRRALRFFPAFQKIQGDGYEIKGDTHRL
jgi:hypothetical protein